MRRAAAILVVSASSLFLGALLGGCDSLEAKLIFPGAASQGQAYAQIAPGSDYRLIPLRLADGTKIVAQFGAALDRGGRPSGATRGAPTVIFFYGNGAYAAGMAGEFWNFRRLGLNTLLVEYPGYGMSEGKPGEERFYQAADAAYAYLQGQPDIDPRRIVAAGWSMGAAVAIDLASRFPVSALIAVDAFTTLPETAHVHAPWMPTSLIIRSRFDNLGKIPRVACPILIVHGDRDEIVPPAMSGRLAAAARSPVTAYTVAGAGHNDTFGVGGDPLWQEIGAFLATGK
jgi:fermentation-respiration switch protein FrsA (DUF1100 family)